MSLSGFGSVISRFAEKEGEKNRNLGIVPKIPHDLEILVTTRARAPQEQKESTSIRVLAYPVEASGLSFFYVNSNMTHASPIGVDITTLSSDGVHAAVGPIICLDWADPCFPAP